MIKIGDTIYIIYKNTITKEKVYMIGENEFIHGHALNSNYVCDYRNPLSFNEENKKWFKDLDKAKKCLKEKTGCDIIKQIETDYWEVS